MRKAILWGLAFGAGIVLMLIAVVELMPEPLYRADCDPMFQIVCAD